MGEGNSLRFGFDIGLGSLGIAARKGHQFLEVDSLLIDEDVADLKGPRERRRAFRTRQAHQAREAYLRRELAALGIEVLHGKRPHPEKGWAEPLPADSRLVREFPAAGDSTLFTSCLLRIALLQGHKLEAWQVFKALHSCIQHRGYAKAGWSRSAEAEASGNGDKAAEEDAVTALKAEGFRKRLEEMTRDPAYQHPCYYEAWRLKLWDPGKPDEWRMRLDHDAGRARGHVYPKDLVVREFLALVKAASRWFPALEGQGPRLAYGVAQAPDASLDPALARKFDLRRGGATDWEAALGQKIPRFDNRIIAKCCLIPRLNVCKVRPWAEAKKNLQDRVPTIAPLRSVCMNPREPNIRSR